MQFFRSTGVDWKKLREDFCDFLYITGIQTIRILKRIHRRILFFLRPLGRLLFLIYAKTLGRQVARISAEIEELRDSVRREKERRLAERQKGVKRNLAYYGRMIGSGFRHHKRLFYGFLNVAAPTVCILLLVFTVKYWSGLNYGLVISYGGEDLATIQNEGVFEQAAEMVSGRMIYDAAASTDVDLSPTFTLTVSDMARYAVPSKLCDIIIRRSNGIIEEASGLYVDGSLVGAVKSSADLSFILQNILNDAKGGGSDAKATFAENVETINGLFPTDSVISADSLNGILTGTSSADSVYVVKKGDTFSSIAKKYDISVDLLKSLNSGTKEDALQEGMKVRIKEAKSLLSIQLEKRETHQEILNFRTVTVKDDSHYTDYSTVEQEGKNGVQELTDKVVYLNGQEVSRTNLSKKTIEEPVEKRIVVGSKRRPTGEIPGEASGILMWPVPSIHTITSYFAWRWGTMHTGLDISGGNSYGRTIVAADGGTVSSVIYSGSGYGYHVEIDHGNGMSTLYAHCSKILVTPGQKVAKGQAIAQIGSTGDSTGNHCHFEVIVNGQKVNPLNYVHN